MGIAQKVARNFSDAVRSRGQSYFSKGRVTLMSAKPSEVVAKVRGTTKYRVRVRLRGSKLLASCTCPYFSPQGEPCKHLWATLLLADARRLLADSTCFAVRFILIYRRRSTLTGSLPDARRSELSLQPEPRRKHRPELGMNMGGERRLVLASRPSRSAHFQGRPSRTEVLAVRQAVQKRKLGWSPIRVPSARSASCRAWQTQVDSRASCSPSQAVNRNAKRLLVYVLDVAPP